MATPFKIIHSDDLTEFFARVNAAARQGWIVEWETFWTTGWGWWQVTHYEAKLKPPDPVIPPPPAKPTIKINIGPVSNRLPPAPPPVQKPQIKFNIGPIRNRL